MEIRDRLEIYVIICFFFFMHTTKPEQNPLDFEQILLPLENKQIITALVA